MPAEPTEEQHTVKKIKILNLIFTDVINEDVSELFPTSQYSPHYYLF